MEETRNAFKIVVAKREGRRPLGRPWHRWEDNIKMEVKEIEHRHGFDLYGGRGSDSADSGGGPVEGSCDCGT
jgi:hypothetical protein